MRHGTYSALHKIITFFQLELEWKLMVLSYQYVLPLKANKPMVTVKLRGGFPGGSAGKIICLQCGSCRRHGFDPWIGKSPWRRAWKSTPVFSPGKSHGERSLVAYSPQGRKELDTTERLHFHFQVCFSSLT